MSQNNIDQLILSNIQTPGTFVEAGGSHPTDQSCTYLLELHGWNGMIVEPKIEFNESYREIRPNTIVENYALVSREYGHEVIEGDFSHYMMGGVKNYHNFANWNPTKYPCTTLDKLLELHNIKEVTVLFLDVEGYEGEVLHGIDFGKVFFHILIIENHWNKDDFNFLEEFGFVRKHKLPIFNHEIYINILSPYYETFTL